MTGPNRISAEELNSLIGTAVCPALFDVRRKPAFEEAGSRISSAIWHEHTTIEAVCQLFDTDKGAVVYCVHGHNVSEIAAARLRAAGVSTRILEGGISAFAEKGGLTVKKASHLPAGDYTKPSIWITRERPKIDRIACPWLIRRFIDPYAEFQFVAAEWVREIAEEMGGTAYDVDGVF
jgi:rhodanese-related sulfurtransferase